VRNIRNLKASTQREQRPQRIFLILKEFSLRPLYDLQEQLALFAKKDGGPSQIDQWMTSLADFFVEQGRITAEEKEKFLKGGYITDKILKMVAEQQTKQ